MDYSNQWGELFRVWVKGFCFIGSCKGVGISLVSKQVSLSLSPLSRKPSHKLVFFYPSYFCPTESKEAVTLCANKYKAFSKRGGWCKSQSLKKHSFYALSSKNKDIYFISLFIPCPITIHSSLGIILSNLIWNLRNLILSSDFQPPCDIICWNQVTDVGLWICLDFLWTLF